MWENLETNKNLGKKKERGGEQDYSY